MKPQPAPDDRVFPTPERFFHDFLEYAEVVVYSELGKRSTSKALTHRVRTQRVIDILARKGVISEQQHTAAEKLWDAIHQARMVGFAKINAVNVVVSCSSSPWTLEGPSREAAAREAVAQALRAVPASLHATLREVVAYDMALRYVAARRGGDTGRALAAVKGELCEALDALVRFWKL